MRRAFTGARWGVAGLAMVPAAGGGTSATPATGVAAPTTTPTGAGLPGPLGAVADPHPEE